MRNCSEDDFFLEDQSTSYFFHGSFDLFEIIRSSEIGLVTVKLTVGINQIHTIQEELHDETHSFEAFYTETTRNPNAKSVGKIHFSDTLDICSLCSGEKVRLFPSPNHTITSFFWCCRGGFVRVLGAIFFQVSPIYTFTILKPARCIIDQDG